MEEQLVVRAERVVVMPLVQPVAVKWVDLQFRSSKEPLWLAYRPFVFCYMNPIRAAAFL